VDDDETKLGRASKRSAMKRLVGMVEVGRNRSRAAGAAKERGGSLLCSGGARRVPRLGLPVQGVGKRVETT
jgi:hypothetical protein